MASVNVSLLPYVLKETPLNVTESKIDIKNTDKIFLMEFELGLKILYEYMNMKTLEF